MRSTSRMRCRSATTGSSAMARCPRWSRPGGSVDWMCLPRFDSPSVFGAVLGQRAGSLHASLHWTRECPAARRYLPGTMVLETSWGTPTGWMIVRDVLLIGPWHHQDDRSATYRRTPTDYEAEHVLLRTIRCVSGEVQTIDGLRAGARLWAGPGPLGVHRGRLPPRPWPPPRARTSPSPSPPTCCSGSRVARPTRARCSRRVSTRFVALSWGGAEAADDVRRRLSAAGVDRPSLAALAGAWRLPGPPVAQLSPAQRADAARSHLRADRGRDGGQRRRRCPRPRAATATTTTGSAGSATRRSPCGGCTRSASTGRPSTSSPSSPTSPRARATCRSCTASAVSAT